MSIHLEARTIQAPFPRKSPLVPWSILLSAVTVAIASATTIYQLNQAAEYSNNTRLLLTQVKEQVSRLNALEWEGISKGTIDQNLTEELAENQQSTTIIFNQLRQVEQTQQLRRIFALYAEYKAEIDRALALVAQGKADSAIDVDAEAIDEIYDELYAEITTLEGISVQHKERTRGLADIGTTLSLLLAALTIGWLSHRFSKDLWLKNEALAAALQEIQQTQNQLIQQEKLAALGQLIAGVAHEINNPLGVIQASANNTNYSLQSALTALQSLNQQLTPTEQESFFALITHVLKQPVTAIPQESRSLKRRLTADLKEQGIADAREIADLLIDMGVYENLEGLLPLLRSEQSGWAIQLAYDLTGALANNQMILNAVERSSKIVFSLKSYAHFDHSGKKQLMNVVEGLETTIAIYQNQLKRNIEVIRDYQEIPGIWGYPDELIQVWTNLIHNAVQAMSTGGKLTIATRQQADSVVVSVIDTGTGIPVEVQQKIFDAFFTTKPAGEGSGLGLHISQKIIGKHQGQMTVKSEPGQTQFDVWLPIQSCGTEISNITPVG